MSVFTGINVTTERTTARWRGQSEPLFGGGDGTADGVTQPSNFYQVAAGMR